MTENRRSAALASAGRSSKRIHDVAFQELEREGLGGVALDFGAGHGEFAARLVLTGAFERVLAADLARYAQIPAEIEWIEADLNRPLPVPTGSCDVIVAIEIVEHLENIRATCREWARLLRPGGRIVLTTPNNESIRALLSLAVRHHFIAFIDECYPAHITALVRADITRALREAELEPIRFFFTDEGCVPKLTRLTWQELSYGLLRGVRFSDNLGCVARRTSIDIGSRLVSRE